MVKPRHTLCDGAFCIRKIKVIYFHPYFVLLTL